MRIDEDLIRHIAKISRLDLDDSEVSKFVPEFKEILEAFSKIDEVDTEDLKLSIQPVEIRNVLRDDAPGKCLTQEQALSLTKHKKDAYFKGPKVV